MNQTPTTTLIIVAYGQPALTELLLDSIAQHTPEPHEVIVVDNDSPTTQRNGWQTIHRAHTSSTHLPISDTAEAST